MSGNAWGSDDWAGVARAGLGQGLALGSGDEAEAMVRAIRRVPDGRNMGARRQAYNEELAAIRGQMHAFSAKRPVVAGSAEFVGGLLPMAVPIAGIGMEAAQGARLATEGTRAANALRVARAATAATATGAAQGGAYGYMAGENPLERRIGAQVGGVLGGLTGGVLGGASAARIAKPVAVIGGAALAAGYGAGAANPRPMTPEERLMAELEVQRGYRHGGSVRYAVRK